MVSRDAETSTAVTDPPQLVDQLRGLAPVSRFTGRNGTKADVVIYRVEGALVALKDYSSRAWWVRQTWGRFCVRRETAVYQVLGNARGVPEFLGRVGAFALALRYVEARSLALIDPAATGSGWCDDLESVVAELHARGVAHGDLHHRDVLIGTNDSVHVVDFATAWVIQDSSGPLRRAVFERFRDADRVAMARMRARASGRDPEEAVREIGGRAARWHARGRRVKRWLDRIGRR